MSKKEGRYYVEYLGWKESRGLFGREFTEPVIKELLARRRNSELPRMTIKLNNNELQISQEGMKQAGGKPEKTKYPGIPTKDVSFVIQGFYPDTDVVACIFLGYNPYTKCAIHVHVYRFDSEATAGVFVNHLSNITDKPDFKSRIRGIEQDLAEIGHVTTRQQLDTKTSRHNSEGSDGLSYGTQSPQSADSLSPKYPTAEEALKRRPDIKIQKSPKPIEVDKNVKRTFSSLHEELEYKMSLEDAPILLPPKDYDTIVRRHGKLDIRDEVKATSRTIVGPNGIFSHVGAQPFVGQLDEVSSESEKTHGSDSTDNGNGNHIETNGNSKSHSIVRSQSDTNANLASSQLHRRHSQASSDRSNNSDEFFSDGLYQGYRPRKHGRSRSKENGRLYPDENGTPMAMWSPSYSFGQTGIKSLPTHHEEEVDVLNRTAPAGLLTRDQFEVPVADYNGYTITRKSEQPHVKRSHSHKQKGEHSRNKFR